MGVSSSYGSEARGEGVRRANCNVMLEEAALFRTCRYCAGPTADSWRAAVAVERAQISGRNKLIQRPVVMDKKYCLFYYPLLSIKP
jgi:hypothetical protein